MCIRLCIVYGSIALCLFAYVCVDRHEHGHVQHFERLIAIDFRCVQAPFNAI